MPDDPSIAPLDTEGADTDDQMAQSAYVPQDVLAPLPPSHLPEVASEGELVNLPSPPLPSPPTPLPQGEGNQNDDLQSPAPPGEGFREGASLESPSLLVGEGFRVGGSVSEADPQLDALSRKIMQYPDAPVNYVLRGEVYLDYHDTERAAADFRQAIALAEDQDATLDWGYINAAYIDRAVDGLRKTTYER